MRLLIDIDKTFTRSDGTIVARIYERLTKASRRREQDTPTILRETAYRRGLYDALKAVQEELKDHYGTDPQS